MSDLLVMLSGFKTKKWVCNIALICLIIYMLATTQWEYGIAFPLVNIGIMSALSLLIRFTGKQKWINAILSILSKLIYSVIIDIICFYWFPLYDNSMNLFQYILSGIVFNWKSLVINTLIFLIIVLAKMIVEKRYESKIISTR